ncbi:MAG: UDP-N-acetylmuramoyl-L-alanyl-D-glutamate--2,6-diaminopimelate ligase [Acidobacteriota bacterium]|nr:UDP-N-acetylmuramoyl-L-alanyl-D-glutamate--2,6-diaminopimelate ligase [Acidobacteriota bacterium]
MTIPTRMTLAGVLKGVASRGEMPGERWERTVAGLEYDSRKVEKDTLFFAFPGARVDGRQFATEAVARGACAVVSELPPAEDIAVPWIHVEHGRKALAIAARNFYARPDERVRFTGITGTNGKTTTAYLADAVLRAGGALTAMIGTIEYRIGEETRKAPNTTPESLDVMRLAAELEQRGGRYLTMEVSSHGLALARVYGIEFHTAVFTNLTRDHLDFHHTMEEYAAAKRLLFIPEDGPPPRWAILNADDPASADMRPAGARTISYGISTDADLRAENIRSGFAGLHFDVLYQGQRQAFESPLVGRINVLNILAAVGAGLSYGMDLAAIAEGIRACPPVPGRFERIDAGQPFFVVVDYAHTDDALRNVIQISRELAGQGRVITLFGCGGDRDRTKRPLMGMAAAELSDLVVLTSDNPRSEDPLGIMNDVMVGLGRFDTPHVAEPDRAKAIAYALGEAKPGDVVLLAGKGHETYQILQDRTIDFDDRETARQALRSLGYEKHAV